MIMTVAMDSEFYSLSELKYMSDQKLEDELTIMFNRKRKLNSEIDKIDTEIIGIKEILRERRLKKQQEKLLD